MNQMIALPPAAAVLPASAEGRPAEAPATIAANPDAELVALGERYEVLLDKYYAAHAAWSRGDVCDPSKFDPSSYTERRSLAREMRKLPVTSLEGLRARMLLTMCEVMPLCRDDVEYYFGDEFAFQELFSAVIDVVGLSDKLAAKNAACGYEIPPLWVDEGDDDEEEEDEAEAES